VRRDLLLVDGVIAALIAVLIVVLSPGWAITGVIGLIVLVVCGVSLIVGRRRRIRSRRVHPSAGRRRRY
jgi:uncharacterized membrane protein SirB2